MSEQDTAKTIDEQDLDAYRDGSMPLPIRRRESEGEDLVSALSQERVITESSLCRTAAANGSVKVLEWLQRNHAVAVDEKEEVSDSSNKHASVRETALPDIRVIDSRGVTKVKMTRADLKAQLMTRAVAHSSNMVDSLIKMFESENDFFRDTEAEVEIYLNL